MYERTYHAKVLKKDQEQPKPQKFAWKKIIIILSTLVIFFGIIAFIRVQRFQVRDIEVLGTRVADPVEVSQYVLSSLSGNYLWILPKSSIVLINPDKLSKEIKEKFPRFKFVEVSRKGMNGLTVQTEEYPGVYLWCDKDGVCSFMDEGGIVFADAPVFSGSAYLKIYGGERLTFPFQPITDDQVKNIVKIKNKLMEMEIEPIEFYFDLNRKLTVIFIHDTNPVEIYFDAVDNPDLALETLYTGLQTNPLMSMYLDNKNILEYLDLRFSNKLVYKFK